MATGSILVYAYILIYYTKNRGFENQWFLKGDLGVRGFLVEDLRINGFLDADTKRHKTTDYRQKTEKISTRITRRKFATRSPRHE